MNKIDLPAGKLKKVLPASSFLLEVVKTTPSSSCLAYNMLVDFQIDFVLKREGLGLGRQVFILVTRVRIPLGPLKT